MNIKTYSIDSKIYVIISIISLTLLSYSISEMRPIIVNITDFLGMTSHLTLAYWAGFGIITLFSIILFLDKPNKDYIYLIYLVIIGLYLFAVPIFAEDNARFAWSYYPAGEVKNVISTKTVDIADKYPLLSYRSWPAVHFLSVNIIYFTDIKLESLIKYMPLFWMTLFIFITFSTGKRFKLSNNRSFIMSVIVISSFWSFHYYYGPQSLGHLLYISSFMMMAGFNKNIRGIIVTLLIFMTAVMTHMLTSIALILSFISSSRLLTNKSRAKFIMALLIIFVIWYVYIAPTMFNIGAKEFVKQMTSVDTTSFTGAGKYDAGELLTRQITHYARISYLGIYALLMTASVAIYATGRIKEQENRLIFKTSFYWLIGTLILIVFKYGNVSEMEDRIYILSLIPMAMIFVSSFKDRTLVVIAVLFLALHIPAHYGSESADQTLTTDLKGAEFFATNVPSYNATYSYYYSTYVVFNDPKKIFMTWRSFTGMGKADISRLDTTKYIVRSDGTYNFMMYARGYDPVQEWLDNNKYNNDLNMLYDNGHFEIYKRQKMLR